MMAGILEELTALFNSADLPVETGAFTGKPPDKYLVLTPIYEDFGLYGDNRPIVDTQWAQVSLFDKGNYTETKNAIVGMLLANDFFIVGRAYVGYENDTKYHHFAIDAQKFYERVK
jgi:hypothetical protein